MISQKIDYQMKTKLLTVLLIVGAALSLPELQADAPPAATTSESDVIPAPTSIVEARARARLLHESIHGTLQIVPRDFFLEDESHSIPSASLEDVFEELSDSYQVELKWLIVETDIVNVDHQAADDFEKAAVVALKDGKPRFAAVEGERYRFAGPIRLASQCLKCHVQQRTSTADRTAGLLISMPLNLPKP